MALVTPYFYGNLLRRVVCGRKYFSGLDSFVVRGAPASLCSM